MSEQRISPKTLLGLQLGRGGFGDMAAAFVLALMNDPLARAHYRKLAPVRRLQAVGEERVLHGRGLKPQPVVVKVMTHVERGVPGRVIRQLAAERGCGRPPAGIPPSEAWRQAKAKARAMS